MMSNQDPWNASGIDPLHKLELARNEITRLLTALAEAERDAERYRWMRNHWYHDERFHGEVFDKEIDAAMAREER